MVRRKYSVKKRKFRKNRNTLKRGGKKHKKVPKRRTNKKKIKQNYTLKKKLKTMYGGDTTTENVDYTTIMDKLQEKLKNRLKEKGIPIDGLIVNKDSKLKLKDYLKSKKVHSVDDILIGSNKKEKENKIQFTPDEKAKVFDVKKFTFTKEENNPRQTIELQYGGANTRAYSVEFGVKKKEQGESSTQIVNLSDSQCPAEIYDREENLKEKLQSLSDNIDSKNVCDQKKLRRGSLNVHPDKNPGCKDLAHDKFIILNDIKEKCIEIKNRKETTESTDSPDSPDSPESTQSTDSPESTETTQPTQSTDSNAIVPTDSAPPEVVSAVQDIATRRQLGSKIADEAAQKAREKAFDNLPSAPTHPIEIPQSEPSTPQTGSQPETQIDTPIPQSETPTETQPPSPETPETSQPEDNRKKVIEELIEKIKNMKQQSNEIEKITEEKSSEHPKLNEDKKKEFNEKVDDKKKEIVNKLDEILKTLETLRDTANTSQSSQISQKGQGKRKRKSYKYKTMKKRRKSHKSHRSKRRTMKGGISFKMPKAPNMRNPFKRSSKSGSSGEPQKPDNPIDKQLQEIRKQLDELSKSISDLKNERERIISPPTNKVGDFMSSMRSKASSMGSKLSSKVSQMKKSSQSSQSTQQQQQPIQSSQSSQSTQPIQANKKEDNKFVKIEIQIPRHIMMNVEQDTADKPETVIMNLIDHLNQLSEDKKAKKTSSDSTPTTPPEKPETNDTGT